MEQMADVVIVSIFGRGNWLASELATLGWKTTLVDVSSRMGEWQSADTEGPFGVLDASDLLASQKTRLQEELESVTVPSGFSIWTKQGPIEFRSEMTQFLMKQREVSPMVERYLRQLGMPTRETERDRKELERMPFERNWLACFAHQLSSTVFSENHLSLEQGTPQPLFLPFSIRRLTADGYRRSLAACASAGVTVRANANVADIRLNQRAVDAIEVQDEQAGVLRGRGYVWMLSGEESLRFNSPVHSTLFPNGAMGPDWYWSRFRVELRGRQYEGQLSPWTTLLEDPFLPWTHTNCMIMRTLADDAIASDSSRGSVSDSSLGSGNYTKTSGTQPRGLDIWMRLPMWSRFDFGYLQDMQYEMEKILARRLPQSEPVTKEMPVEFRVAREKLGPPRFPVYSAQNHGRTENLIAANLLFDGPEYWASLDAIGQLRHHSQLLEKLNRMKESWDQADRKAALAAEKQSSRSSQSGGDGSSSGTGSGSSSGSGMGSGAGSGMKSTGTYVGKNDGVKGKSLRDLQSQPQVDTDKDTHKDD